MKTIAENLTPEEAWLRLSVHPSLPIQSLSVQDAFDHVLAADLFATEDVPSGKRSFRDGYAVQSRDLSTLPTKIQLIHDIPMGIVPTDAIRSGQTMSIPTGGYLPEGADAVVMQEDTERNGNEIVVKRSVAPGENVQEIGEDFQKGELLFSAGHRLRSQDIAAIAMFGTTHAPVFRKPVLKIISTGNELVPFSSKEKTEGQIRETNSLALNAASHRFGFVAESEGIVKDEFEAQRNAVERALREVDVILVSGGSSVGERDFTMEVIQSFSNSQVHFHGLAIRPGHPTIFASVGNGWIFGLPGHPVSSLVVFYVIVLPFLFHLSGERIHFQDFLKSKFRTGNAKLNDSIQPLKIKTDYVRLRLKKEGHHWSADPLPGKSASLSTLSGADAFTIVSPGRPTISAGTQIEFILFP